jgi:hypothetical protein
VEESVKNVQIYRLTRFPYVWWQDDLFGAIFKDMTGKICGLISPRLNLSGHDIHWAKIRYVCGKGVKSITDR